MKAGKDDVSGAMQLEEHAEVGKEVASSRQCYSKRGDKGVGEENEDMWWRSDSSLDGRELDDLDYIEDPLYDALLDEKDTQWTEKLRNGRQSDAILSCPCCLTTLCIDCQQHAEMIGRFRAMYVMNCRVDVGQRRGYRESDTTKKRPSQHTVPPERAEEWARVWGYSPEPTKKVCKEPEDTAAAVFCRSCGLEVAVYDSDEVYHFHNVFPSNA